MVELLERRVFLGDFHVRLLSWQVWHWLTRYANGVYSSMRFIETQIFTKQVQKLLKDDSYRMLQSALMLRPDAAPVIPGSGGLRKMRWSLPGSGKRGSLRVLYYWDLPEDIYMIFIYQKVKQESITPAQLKVLRKLVEENLK